jgi:hypothetical protein
MKPAFPNDVHRLVAMMSEFYAEGGYPLNHQRATEAFLTLLADDRLGYVWFIQADGQDVGHVVLTLCYSMEYGGLNAFVEDLFAISRRGAWHCGIKGGASFLGRERRPSDTCRNRARERSRTRRVSPCWLHADRSPAFRIETGKSDARRMTNKHENTA